MPPARAPGRAATPGRGQSCSPPRDGGTALCGVTAPGRLLRARVPALVSCEPVPFIRAPSSSEPIAVAACPRPVSDRQAAPRAGKGGGFFRCRGTAAEGVQLRAQCVQRMRAPGVHHARRARIGLGAEARSAHRAADRVLPGPSEGDGGRGRGALSRRAEPRVPAGTHADSWRASGGCWGSSRESKT